MSDGRLALTERLLRCAETGADLGPQLWVGHRKPTPALMEPIKMARVCGHEDRLVGKPFGGLWTSSLLPGPWSDWLRWGADEEFVDMSQKRWWRLDPAPESRILRIDTHADLVAVLDAYPSRPYPFLDRREPDFARLAADGWDGIHLTEHGQDATRYTVPDHLDGWDCESTLWFNWRFLGEPALVYSPDGIAVA